MLSTEQMKTAMFHDSFIVIDTESTGFQPNNTYSKLLEIGALKIKNGIVVDTYDQIINPGCDIPTRIAELTGITKETVEGMPDIPHAIEDFRKWCGKNFVFIGHNIYHDTNFLNFFGKQCGIEFNEPCIDTMVLGKAFLKGKNWLEISKKVKEGYKLETLAQLFEIPDNSHHRANNDAKVTWEVFCKIKQFAIKKDSNLIYRQYVYPEDVYEDKEQKPTYVLNANPWDTGKRLYIRLKQVNNEEESFSDVFYDFKKKSWGVKNSNFPVNFNKLENVIKMEYGCELSNFDLFNKKKFFKDKAI